MTIGGQKKQVGQVLDPAYSGAILRAEQSKSVLASTYSSDLVGTGGVA